MPRPAHKKLLGWLLEAEVAPRSQVRFEKRYHAATKVAVSPGTTAHYQSQPGKWGAELRLYFDDPGMAAALAASGLHVEYRKAGYHAGGYRYRINNNRFWWALVEDHGLRLGLN